MTRLTPSEWQAAQAQADSFFAAVDRLVADHELHKARIERLSKRLEAACG